MGLESIEGAAAGPAIAPSTVVDAAPDAVVDAAATTSSTVVDEAAANDEAPADEVLLLATSRNGTPE